MEQQCTSLYPCQFLGKLGQGKYQYPRLSIQPHPEIAQREIQNCQFLIRLRQEGMAKTVQGRYGAMDRTMRRERMECTDSETTEHTGTSFQYSD